MTGYDQQKGDLLATADEIYQVGVADGKASQQGSDQAAIDNLNALVGQLQATDAADLQTIATLNAQVAALEAQLNQNPPPPPPAGPLFGANFGDATQALYPAVVPVARIFPSSGYPANLMTLASVKQAVAKKTKVVILDFPASTTDAQATASVKQAVAAGLETWASGTHEPEHNAKMTSEDWVAQNVHLSPIIRAAGGKVAPILQSATLASLQGRNPADYALPKGTVDAWGTDVYPLTKAISQAELLTAILAGAKIAFPGVTDWIVGEYGVPGGNAQLVKDFKTFGAAHGLLRACFWSQGTTVLASDTAAAWF